MAASTSKRKHQHVEESTLDGDDLFVNEEPDSSENDDGDTTDSDESIYSGLEEEDSSDEEDEPESFEEASDSDDDGEKLDNRPNTKQKQRNGKTDKATKQKQRNDKTDIATTSTSKDINLNAVPPADEYDFDSSDEEDIRNTVGNIPMEWYREYPHIGYDTEGRKLIKPEQGDELDAFLNKMDNPDYWRTVKDKNTGQNVVLSNEDINVIQNIRKGKYADGNYNPYEKWVDTFTHETMIHPVTNTPEHKRSFIPSHLERLKVGRMVHAMKMGWMKTPSQRKKELEEPEPEKFYLIWENDDQAEISKRYMGHIPAPKMALPGHAESYNPPPEYLMTEEEELAWNEADPEDRKINFIPRKYNSLRLVPAYKKFINERFERCLDLYLCPRQRKMRMNVDPQDLIPKLPKPRDLQPFPTTQSLVYRGHKSLIRCISVDPTGEWLCSGSDDGTVKFWEISTARCMKTLDVGGVVKSIEWNPNTALCLVAFTVGEQVILVNPGLGDSIVVTATDSMLSNLESQDTDTAIGRKINVDWINYDDEEYEKGFRIKVKHPKELSQVTWHARGDYFAVVQPTGETMSVLMHQLSKKRTQNPFSKSKGLVQRVRFHPTRPFFFVATQRYVRVYNLMKQELTKKLLTNCKWVSSLAVHPGGDNVIIGSYDCRLSWFDMDLSTKPYQTLRHHRKAVRQVTYHRSYPLFASASDDGTVIVCHGKVYNDLLQNPLIVPVKVLRGHERTKDLGVLDCQFHPTQPWLFSSGSDATIRLFT